MRYIAIILFLFNVASAQSLFGVVASDGFDADAKAYLNAAGITDASQRSSFNTFVKGMKANNLWAKAAAIYPFMGGTESSHKWNAKDPRDLNAAYRLTFANGATHNSNGVTFNGSNQYANTFLNPKNITADSNSFSFGIYNRTNNSGAIVDMGVASNSGTTSSSLYLRWTDNNLYVEMYRAGADLITVANGTDARGFYLTSRTTSTSLKAYKNGSQFGTTQTATNTTRQVNDQMLIGALNSVGIGVFNYSNRNYCFAIIMNTGLSDSEASTLSSLINTLQTALGRNTY